MAPTSTTDDQVVVDLTGPGESPPWRRRFQVRRVAALLLGVAVLAAPMVAATIVVLAVARAFDPPAGTAVVVWWVAVAAVSWVVAFGVDRVVRRHLPLVGLYRLALVLPADVPSRLGVALRARSIRDLEREVIDLRDRPVDDRTTAAARVVALAAALNEHDRFTRGHSERVRAFADLLAGELGVPDEDRELLRWGALLHDIGKLEVSTTLLNKPAALDDHEWLEMRSHPAHGAELAEPLRGWLGGWVDAVGQHHERFDGTGYPRGLTGDEIALAGRIVAVADAYETMTARRPYKRPMPHEAARQELVDQAGAHFDPQVVRAMLNLSVRRLRWAAGPLSIIGDALAAQLIMAVGSAGRVVDTAVRIVPATSAAAVMATAGVVTVGAPEPAPPRPPVPVSVIGVPATDGPDATVRASTSPSTATGWVPSGGWSSLRARPGGAEPESAVAGRASDAPGRVGISPPAGRATGPAAAGTAPRATPATPAVPATPPSTPAIPAIPASPSPRPSVPPAPTPSAGAPAVTIPTVDVVLPERAEPRER